MSIMIRKKNDPMKRISENVLKSKPAAMQQQAPQQPEPMQQQQPNSMMQGMPQGNFGQ